MLDAMGPERRSDSRPALRTSRLREIGIEAGLAAVGVTDVSVLEPARSVLPARRDAGLAATMQFTYRNPERSSDPGRLLPEAASLVVGVLDYERLTREPGPDPEPAGPVDVTGAPGAIVGRVARYARIDAYGHLRAGLGAVAQELDRSGYRTRIVADDNALVDRNAAWRAGLGWYGKNTNLLVRGSGSWYVIGAVATDAVLESDSAPMADGCGPCSVCIDDCPTGALRAPGVLDARRCIAWLVQAGEPIPVEHRTAIGDWLYGCDICQDVCPPNRVVVRRRATSPSPTPDVDLEDPIAIGWVLTATDADLLDRCGRWYIAKRDPDVIRRTALVVLGNTAAVGDPAAAKLVATYVEHPSPLLRAHATWAARRLGLDNVAAPTRNDPDPMVRSEWDVAVTARVAGEPNP